MGKRVSIRDAQYIYTLDGRVIRIDGIIEKGKEYKGIDLTDTDQPEVLVSLSEIYGVVFTI